MLNYFNIFNLVDITATVCRENALEPGYDPRIAKFLIRNAV